LPGFGSSIIPNIALINFDNDLDEDLLVIKNTGNGDACQIDLYDNNGSGFLTFVSSATGLTNSSPVGFANVFDINNDGYNDILLGTKEVVGAGPGNLGLKLYKQCWGWVFYHNSQFQYPKCFRRLLPIAYLRP
jgi:hypothetical protein